jgi:chemotaxis protein methyltransferase WspC
LTHVTSEPHDAYNNLNRPMNPTDPCFETWLSQETGIDASSLGINALERAVQDRVRLTLSVDPVKAVAEDAVDAYWRLLIDSPEERLALIEALVVPETWFFRDREAFVALARLVNEKLARDPARVARVLSVPCSSGEEPYSVAMALFDAGIGAQRFTIDAFDISARAIALAQKAVYGRNSFRGGEFEFRDRHFDPLDGGWVLNERIQQAVRFTQANLFDPSHNAGTRYDFIFCRNVLIYFHRDAQDRAIHLLDARLADGGTIFVGPAETGLMMRHTLSSARIPLAFAFQRTPAEEPCAPAFTLPGNTAAAPQAAPGAFAATRAAAAPSFATRPQPVAPAPRPATFAHATTQPPAHATRQAHGHGSAGAHAKPGASAVPDESLAEAGRLADAGEFDKAEQVAQAFVNVHGTDAEAFYLLGLIADARGRTADASDYYRKTLYLEPAHYEALTHLAALLDMTGDSAGAQQLMRRAQRAASKAHQMTPTTSATKATDDPLNLPRGKHGSRRY